VSIPARNITATGIEKVVVSSSAGSIGAVAADAKIATKEKVVFTFDSGDYGTSVGTGPVKVTVGGASKTVGTTAVAQSMADLVAAINELAGSTIAVAGTGTITVTSGTAGTALPVITFANGTYRAPGLASTAADTAANTTIDTTAATNYSFKQTLQANQAASAAVAASTFAVPTGTTTASLTAKTEVSASAPSTADVTAKGTVVKLSGGLSQTITASNSAQASGSSGDIKVTATLPSTAWQFLHWLGAQPPARVCGGKNVNGY
jgi:hypothetical protein